MESEKGVAAMCKTMEEMRREARQDARCENAKTMLKDGILSHEKIAQYSGLSLAEVDELAAEMCA